MALHWVTLVEVDRKDSWMELGMGWNDEKHDIWYDTEQYDVIIYVCMYKVNHRASFSQSSKYVIESSSKNSKKSLFWRFGA